MWCSCGTDHLDDHALLGRAVKARDVCGSFGVPFIINDRPDLALACGADGVHVGQRDVPVSLARRILGGGSRSSDCRLTPHPSGTKLSRREPTTSLPVPSWPAPTKPGRPGTGLGYLRYVSSTRGAGGVPWFVTGGASPETVPEMVVAGARRFVVVRYLTESEDPETSARDLRSSIDNSLAEVPAG